MIVQEFCPLHESLRWRAGQRSWHALGARAFTSNEVPHEVTNDGSRAFAAAEVFFTNCLEADRRGELEGEIRLVELAAGLGLHARMLLDRFRDLCAETGRDWYRRTTFYVTDASRRMVADMDAKGVLRAHEGRVRLGMVDALRPASFEPLDGGEPVDLHGVRAIVHNYMLGVLPFEILIVGRGEVRRLEVRTVARDPQALRRSVGDDFMRLLDAESEDELNRLARLCTLLDSEWRTRPFDPEGSPYGSLFEPFANERLRTFMGGDAGMETALRVCHSFGGLQSLDACREVLVPGGFLLFGDYGAARFEDLLMEGGFEQFGRSTANALCFLWLDHALRSGASGWANVVRPPGDDRASLHSRLLLTRDSTETRDRFVHVFAHRRLEADRVLMRRARSAARCGDVQRARELYLEVCQRNDAAWSALSHWASLENRAGNHELALDVAQQACAINPHINPRVWIELGQARAGLGDAAGAREDFHRALSIDPRSPHALRRAIWAARELGRRTEALEMIGRFLAHGGSRRHVDWALGVQREILAARATERAELKELSERAERERPASVVIAEAGAQGPWESAPPAGASALRSAAAPVVQAAEVFLVKRQAPRGGWIDADGPLGSTTALATGLVGWALAEPPRHARTRGACVGALRQLVGASGNLGWGAHRGQPDAWTSAVVLQFVARMGMMDESFARRVALAFMDDESAPHRPESLPLFGLALISANAAHSKVALARQMCMAARDGSGTWPGSLEACPSLATALSLGLLARCGGIQRATRRAAGERLDSPPTSTAVAELASRALIRSIVEAEQGAELTDLIELQREDGSWAAFSDGPAGSDGAGVPTTTGFALLALELSLAAIEEGGARGRGAAPLARERGQSLTLH